MIDGSPAFEMRAMPETFGTLNDISYDLILSMINLNGSTTRTVKDRRIFILGPAKSGKDTLACALSKYVRLDGSEIGYKGSTSLTMLPYVYNIFDRFYPDDHRRFFDPNNPRLSDQDPDNPRLSDPLIGGIQPTQSTGESIDRRIGFQEFYSRRGECRVFWYNVIKAYRKLDPHFIIDEDDSDIFVGSRDWDEIRTAIECTKKAYFILCRADDSADPTWPYTYADSCSILNNSFQVRPREIITFDYRDSNFELFLQITEVARNLAFEMCKTLSYLATERNFERHGIRFDDVLKNRF